MAQLTYSSPAPGTGQFQVNLPENWTYAIQAFNDIKTFLNGTNLDTSNLAAAAGITAAQLAGAIPATKLSTGITFTGAANIPGTESRTSTTYTTMPTSDQVTGVVLPANGLIAVWYRATWQESVQGAAQAAIFLNANQLRVPVANTAPIFQETGIGSPHAAGTDAVLSTFFGGLISDAANTAYPGDVSTGQVVGLVHGDLTGFGGPVFISAAAGTYTITIDFKASSGSVTAKNRKLWVAALSF